MVVDSIGLMLYIFRKKLPKTRKMDKILNLERKPETHKTFIRIHDEVFSIANLLKLLEEQRLKIVSLAFGQKKHSSSKKIFKNLGNRWAEIEIEADYHLVQDVLAESGEFRRFINKIIGSVSQIS